MERFPGTGIIIPKIITLSRVFQHYPGFPRKHISLEAANESVTKSLLVRRSEFSYFTLDPSRYNMLQHATTCYNMLQHATTCKLTVDHKSAFS